jgi:ribosomal-protein-alanine N-acetyltransferase
VGYDLYPDFYGKGYMSEAMEAILSFAQSDMKIKHINACIYAGNQPSIDFAEKLGFVFAGETEDTIFRGQKYLHKKYLLRLR